MKENYQKIKERSSYLIKIEDILKFIKWVEKKYSNINWYGQHNNNIKEFFYHI